MISRLIVESYVWLIEFALWVAIGLAGFAGYYSIVPLIILLGGTPTPELLWKVIGVAFFGALALPVLALTAGPFLLMVDIWKTMKNLESRNVPMSTGVPTAGFERKEPTL